MKTTRAESGGGWGGWLCVGKKSNPKMHEQIHMLLIELRRRPYRVECTGSLSTSEVKQHRARLVLGWGTAWEDLRVLSAFPRIRAFSVERAGCLGNSARCGGGLKNKMAEGAPNRSYGRSGVSLLSLSLSLSCVCVCSARCS